jgi:hypothetical protein
LEKKARMINNRVLSDKEAFNFDVLLEKDSRYYADAKSVYDSFSITDQDTKSGIRS